MTDAGSLRYSICICTRNRAERLHGVLDALAREVPTVGVRGECIVVDNGSTDATRDVVEQSARRFDTRYVSEQRVGVSFARNRAIAEARGEILLWLDDDVEVPAGWLANVLAPFDDAAVMAVGGPIKAIWPADRPRWIPDPLRPPFPAVTLNYDLGDQRRTIPHGGDYPPTANLAVRRVAALAVGGFDETLGHFGKRRMGGEDMLFGFKLTRQFGPIQYEPSAGVGHPVEPHRMGLGYSLNHLFWLGFSSVRAEPTFNQRGEAERLPRWVFGRLLGAMGDALAGLVTLNTAKTVRGIGQSAVALGRISGGIAGPRVTTPSA